MQPTFRGQRAFLSNFYYCEFEYQGIRWRSSEAAFQAMKTFDSKLRIAISKMSPSDSKRAGRQVPLRSDWEKVKNQIMFEILLAKFLQNPDLLEKLIDTTDEELVETNNWGDTYWGVCNGRGQNRLGKLLMKIRNQYR